MEEDLGKLADQIRRNALGFLVIVLLLFPSSFSVLCIAPGGHVAIEDINALCCVSPVISLPSGSQLDAVFDGPGGCDNCTDLFLASNRSAVLTQSANLVASSPSDAECLDTYLSADISVSQCRSGKIGSIAVLIPVYSSIPLRC